MTIEEVNALDVDGFVEAFGFLFEHSPWVVRQAADRRPFADEADMHRQLTAVVAEAPAPARLALVCAHPELAGKAAVDGTLTDASAAEQAAAGLDRLTPAEFEAFHTLNLAYLQRFAFPFIICVRLTNKAGILAAMRARLENDRDAELEEALVQVGEIVRLRLHDRLR